MEKPKSLNILGEVVYNASEILQYDKRFFVGCVNSRNIVEKKELTEDMYFYAYDKDGTWIKSKETYKRAKLFLKEDYVLNNVPNMKEHTETETEEEQTQYKYEELPEILELEDHEKFKDENGVPMEIEVRGTRKSDDCYFRVKDVSKSFGMPSLNTTILIHNYIKDIDYKTFINTTLSNRYSVHNKKSLFLTYEGMVKLLYVSRNGKAKAFREWATKKLFVAQMGTEEDRDDFAAELIGVSSKTIQNVFRHNVSKTPCVYLVYIGSAAKLLSSEKYTDDHMLCKFGKCNNMPRRLTEHQRDFKKLFGTNVELLLFSIVDVRYLDTAEENLRHYFEINRVEHKNVKDENSKELVVFHKDEIKRLKEFYRMTQNNYIGQLSGLEAEVAELKKEILKYIHQLELKDKDIELLKEQHKNELKHKENELKDKEIELLTMKVQFFQGRAQ